MDTTIYNHASGHDADGETQQGKILDQIDLFSAHTRPFLRSRILYAEKGQPIMADVGLARLDTLFHTARYRQRELANGKRPARESQAASSNG